MLVQQGQHEFLIDFIQGIVQPRQVVARVVLPPAVVAALINAVRENLTHYQNQFGQVPALKPPPPPPTPPSIEEIYSSLKLPDELLSGVYANAALIVHSQTEFCMDFITNYYPRLRGVVPRLPGGRSGAGIAANPHSIVPAVPAADCPGGASSGTTAAVGVLNRP